MKSVRSIWSEWPFMAGVVFSTIVIGVFCYSLSLPVTTEMATFETKWDYLKRATPNEVGDTLAGIAGSLAFVWLVVTVLLQAKELREQRQEFAKIAEAQDKQVVLLKIQGDIFLKEQQQREREFELASVKSMASSLVTYTKQADRECIWTFIDTENEETTTFDKPFDTETSTRIHSCTGAFSSWLDAVKEKHSVAKIVNAPKDSVFREMLVTIENLIERGEVLGADVQIRVNNMRLHELRSLVVEALQADLWHRSVNQN